jgi:hypothetical protein
MYEEKELRLDSMGLTSLSLSLGKWTAGQPVIKSLNLTNNSLSDFVGQNLTMLESLYISCNSSFIADNNNLKHFIDNILPGLQLLDISTKLLTVGQSISLSTFSGNEL